ncbi:hypothetical protein [Candidatus Cytomitobacter primus]|uniref:TGS domain-containing protein n=1 Tax=Candidatus Cytomitobacter primus TaxID=2066024 RepID=A0A5C0UF66_9PROT|nr:hypothetical protein [Candidatus Cytomitobacter primus]QEK38419.1 hypothetical protein FZC34_00590 [Candidatus Cytomitobacter primus]
MNRKNIIEQAIKGIDLISKLGLDADIIGFKSADKVYDLHAEIPVNTEVISLYKSDDEYIHFLRHDAAHVLAQGLTHIFPNIEFGKQFFKDTNVFGFDVFFPEHKFTKDDFPKIEKAMKDVVAKSDDIIRHVWSKEKALQYFPNDQFKQDIISNAPKNTIMLYEHGDYIDICGGPRGMNNSHVGNHFVLLDVQDSEWMFNSSKKMQRIICACFRNESEMKDFLMEYK